MDDCLSTGQTFKQIYSFLIGRGDEIRLLR